MKLKWHRRATVILFQVFGQSKAGRFECECKTLHEVRLLLIVVLYLFLRIYLTLNIFEGHSNVRHF